MEQKSQMPDTRSSLVLGNGLDVLSLIAKTNGELSIREIAAGLGLTSTVSHRLVTTLRNHNYIEKNNGTGKYTIGIESFLVGKVYSGKASLAMHAKPILQEVASKTGTNCYLGIRNKCNIVYLASIPGDQQTNVKVAPGTEIPLHLTAMGLSILSNLDKAELDSFIAFATDVSDIPSSEFDDSFFAQLKDSQNHGYTYHESRIFPGITTIGCAVKNQTGEVIGAISMGMKTQELNKTKSKNLNIEIVRAARRIKNSFFS